MRPSSYPRRVSNGVSQIANSLDQLYLVISIHFFPQLVDGDIDQIVVRFILGTPNRMSERVSGNDLARASRQAFQQSKLRPAQGNLLACAGSIVRGRVQDQIAHSQDLRARSRAGLAIYPFRGQGKRSATHGTSVCFAHDVRSDPHPTPETARE